MRKNMVKSIEKLKKLMEDITETSRKLDVTQQVCHDFFKKRGKESTFSLTAFLDHGVSSGWKHRDSRQSQNEGQSLLSIPSRSGLLRAAALMPQTS